MLTHYKNQSRAELCRLIENEKITYSVLYNILGRKCTDIFTDHENVIVCYSNAPFPVWVWGKDVADLNAVRLIGDCIKEHFPYEKGHYHIMSEGLWQALMRDTYVENTHIYYPKYMESSATSQVYQTVYKTYDSGSTFFDTAIQQKYTEKIDTTSSTSFLNVMMPNVILNSYSAISFSSSTIKSNGVSYDVITINNDNGNKIGSFNLYNGEKCESVQLYPYGWLFNIKRDEEYYYKPLNECLTYNECKVEKNICLVRTAYEEIVSGYIVKYDKYVIIDGLKYKINANKNILTFKPYKLNNLSCIVKKDYYNTLFDYVDATAPILYNANYRWFGNRLIQQTYKGEKVGESKVYQFKIDNYLTEYVDNISICGVTQTKNTVEGESTILYDKDNLLYKINNNGEIIVDVEIIDGNGFQYEGMLHNKNMIAIAKEDNYKFESILNPPLFGNYQLSTRTKSYIVGEMLPYSKDENGDFVLMGYTKNNRLEIQCSLPYYFDDEDKKTSIYENDAKFEEIVYQLSEPQIIETNVNALGLANVNTYYGSGEDHIFKRTSTVNYNTIIDLDDIIITTPIVDNNTCSFKFIKGYNNINSNFFKDVTISCDEIESINIEEDITDEVCYLSCVDGYYIFGGKDDKITCLENGKNVSKTISDIVIGDVIIHNEYNNLGIILPYISQVETISNKCVCKVIKLEKNKEIEYVANYKVKFTYNNIKRIINITM